MRSERLSLTAIIALCVLIGTQGFLMAAIHPDLVEVPFSIQVSFNGSVVDIIDSMLPAGGNNTTVGSANWSGYVVIQASFSGNNTIEITSTIGGTSAEDAPLMTWNGTGLAGSFTTSNGYTIELADQIYFTVVEPDPAEYLSEPVDTVGILIAFGIGVLLWQVFASSMRERSVTW